jgi:hypothetical protein
MEYFVYYICIYIYIITNILNYLQRYNMITYIGLILIMGKLSHDSRILC